MSTHMLQTVGILAGSICIVLAAIATALDKFGLLPKRLGPADMQAEITFERTRGDKAEAELAAERTKTAQLERERSLEPVLQQLTAVADAVTASSESQQQTLEKLASFNGTLTYLEEGLRAATEGLKLVTGLVIGASDAALKTPARRKPAARPRATTSKRKDS